MTDGGFSPFDFKGKRLEVGTAPDGLIGVRKEGADQDAPMTIIDVTSEPPLVGNLKAIDLTPGDRDDLLEAALAAARAHHRSA